MEQYNSHSRAVSSPIVLEGQLRECYGRVVYSHKTHEKCADILLWWHSRFKWAQIILSAITTAGLISVVFGDNELGAVVSAIASVLLLALHAYTKDFDFAALAQKHRRAASDLWLIRERYLSLLTDLRTEGQDVERVRAERDKLLEELHAVYSGAPSTNFKAYKKAQKALQRHEDMTFSDDEIDAFLPHELKRTGPSQHYDARLKVDE